MSGFTWLSYKPYTTFTLIQYIQLAGFTWSYEIQNISSTPHSDIIFSWSALSNPHDIQNVSSTPHIETICTVGQLHQDTKLNASNARSAALSGEITGFPVSSFKQQERQLTHQSALDQIVRFCISCRNGKTDAIWSSVTLYRFWYWMCASHVKSSTSPAISLEVSVWRMTVALGRDDVGLLVTLKE